MGPSQRQLVGAYLGSVGLCHAREGGPAAVAARCSALHDVHRLATQQRLPAPGGMFPCMLRCFREGSLHDTIAV